MLRAEGPASPRRAQGSRQRLASGFAACDSGCCIEDLTKIPYVGGCSEAPFEGGATGRFDQRWKVPYGRQHTVQASPAPVLVLLSGFVRVSLQLRPKMGGRAGDVVLPLLALVSVRYGTECIKHERVDMSHES